MLPREGDPIFVTAIALPSQRSMAEFSPDGRWLAYVSDETGREEVYAQAFPGPGARRMISRDGAD